MTRAVFAGTILAVVAGLATQTANATTYTYTKIAMPGAGETVATGINDHGEVAGYYYVSPPQGGPVTFHGFTFLNGVMTTIDPPASTSTEVTGINNDGTVIGYYQRGNANRVDGFVLRHGVYQHFGRDGFRTSFDAINNNDDIVGTTQSFGDGSFKLFVRSGNATTTTVKQGSRATPLAINDHGELVGLYGPIFGPTSSFVGHAGEYHTLNLPNSNYTLAYGVNDSGAIAGSFVPNGQSGSFGFIDRGGVVTALSLPGSTDTFVQGINASGDVVGYASVAPYTYEAFAEHQGTYTPLTPPGATFSFLVMPQSINASGQTVGNYVDSANPTGFTYLATPQ